MGVSHQLDAPPLHALAGRHARGRVGMRLSSASARILLPLCPPSKSPVKPGRRMGGSKANAHRERAQTCNRWA